MNPTDAHDLTGQQLENSLRFARLALDGAERMIHLQLDSAKQAVEDTARCAARLAEVKDVQTALAAQSELAERATTGLMSYSRGVYELATQAQAEMAHLVEEQVGTSRGNFLSGLDNWSSASPAGADIASSAMRTTFGAYQAAFDNLSKAARQVAEFTDASLKAASTAAVGAFQAGARAA